MDELKQLWNTFTGKVLAGVIVTLISFLATTVWVGMNAGIEKRVSNNESKIEQLQKDYIEIKGDIISEIKGLRKDIKENNSTQTEMQKDIAYLRGKDDVNSKR